METIMEKDPYEILKEPLQLYRQAHEKVIQERPDLRTAIASLITKIQELINLHQENHLVTKVALTFLAKWMDKTNSLQGIPPTITLCRSIDNQSEKELQLYGSLVLKELSVPHLTWTCSSPDVPNYQRGQQAVEEAIKWLLDVMERKDDQKKYKISYIWRHNEPKPYEFYRFLGEAFLQRSRTILVRGWTIPAKKIEALEYTWEWVEKAFQDSQDVTIRQLRARVALEAERLLKSTNDLSRSVPGIASLTKISNLPKDEIKPLLEETIKISNWINNPNLLDVVCQYLCSPEIEEDFKVKTCKEIINSPLNERGVALIKAKAALCSSNSSFPQLASKAVEELSKIPFSDYRWNETVEFIEKLQKDNNEIWKELALEARKICEVKELKEPTGLRLRWYWAKMRDLYDMAFEAAEKEDKEDKVKIADSTKSRPTLRLLAWELIAQKESDPDKANKIREESILPETMFVLHPYRENLSEIQRDQKEKFSKIKIQWETEIKEKYEAIKKIPDDWVALHFYLGKNLIGKHGRVIWWDSAANVWMIEPFDPYPLWEKFRLWRDFYSQAQEKQESSDLLEDICNEMGQQFHFFFDPKKFEKKNFLFIPHGFLHLLPLHAARKGDEFLFQNKFSLYLPAWSLYPGEKPNPPKEGRYLARYFKDQRTDERFSILDSYFDKDKVKKSASPKDVIDLLSGNAPNFLVIESHGEGDEIDPFGSRLLLSSPLTNRDILKSEINLKGTTVILSACETDMTPKFENLIDEHLSLAATFFQHKGAFQVVGALWLCKSDMMNNLKRRYLFEKGKIPAYQIVAEAQKNWLIQKYSIFDVAPLRVFGIPFSKTISN